MLLLSKLTGALSLAFLATIILASPVPDESDSTERPALPSLQDCKDHLKVKKDTSLFYSGDNGEDYRGKAQKKIKDVDKLQDYKIRAMSWTDNAWQDKWVMGNNNQAKEFFQICSRAMAEMSSGRVYVLLPKGTGTDWEKGTVWADYEWPNLGKSVTEVVRIDPWSDHEQIIWPQPGCYGLDTKRYISEKRLEENIEEYCGQAVSKGEQDPNSEGLMRKFNEGNAEEIAIMMYWPLGDPFPTNEKDCKKYLATIKDGCDNDDSKNPKNWKAGGALQLGQVRYQILPIARRDPVPKTPKAAAM